MLSSLAFRLRSLLGCPGQLPLRRPRWAELTAFVLCCCLLVPGCTPSTSGISPATPTATSTPRAAAVQGTLNLLADAVANQDQQAFRAVVSTADPKFATTATMLWRNLDQLALVQLDLTAEALQVPLSAERRMLLGGTAWVQQVRIRWRLPEEQASAEHRVWVTFVADDARPLVAGTIDGPAAEASAQPLWWLEPVTVARKAGSVALVSSGAAAEWAIRAATAARELSRRRDGAAVNGWSGGLVIEVPSGSAAFERVLGVASGSYRRIAAVTWPEGPTLETAALRIVVNAAVVNRAGGDSAGVNRAGETGLSPAGRSILILHEATHVATRSPGSKAPTWVVEGFADYVAYDTYPATRPTASAALLAEVRRAGAPSALPEDREFAPTAPDLDLSYAQAWLACQFAADTYSEDKLATFYSRVDRGVPVGSAMSSVFGVDEAQFTREWQRYLVALSRDR